jgi:hypothetical protein
VEATWQKVLMAGPVLLPPHLPHQAKEGSMRWEGVRWEGVRCGDGLCPHCCKQPNQFMELAGGVSNSFPIQDITRILIHFLCMT